MPSKTFKHNILQDISLLLYFILMCVGKLTSQMICVWSVFPSSFASPGAGISLSFFSCPKASCDCLQIHFIFCRQPLCDSSRSSDLLIWRKRVFCCARPQHSLLLKPMDQIITEELEYLGLRYWNCTSYGNVYGNILL